MRQKKWWAVVILAAVLALGGLAWVQTQQEEATPSGAHADTQASPGDAAGQGVQTFASQAALGADAPDAPDASAGQRQGDAPANPLLDNMEMPVFRAQGNGALVVDPQTRIDVERIQALYSREEAQQKFDELSRRLPDKARHELRNLAQQHAQYDQAVAQTYPPSLNVGSVDEGVRQLEGLHKLRHQYFGAEAAEAMFGYEEKISRELFELMRKQGDPNLSMEEKAARAQEAWAKTRTTQ